MKLLEQLKADLKAALMAKKELEISTLRLLLAEVRNLEIEKKRAALKEEDIVVLIRREIKKRREAEEAFKKGKRPELAEKEKKEAIILTHYLPQEMSEEELTKIVESVVKQIGEVGSKDFGRVMGQVMGQIKGRADGNKVAQLVKKQLQG